MTSKEALEELRFQVGNITYFTHDLQMTTFKVRDSGLFEVIEKDLEVLDLIVRYEINIWGMKKYDYNHYKRVIDYRMPKLVFDRIKKWLEK